MPGVSFFNGITDFTHGSPERIGVLLVNLGTPDAPTAEALRPYLSDFLFDPRVIEVPRLKWWLILKLFILNTRPKQSAKLYQKVWTPEGSPLLVNTVLQGKALQAALDREHPDTFLVEIGMRIGNPSLKSGLEKLRERGATRLFVIPMFPQYSSTTSGSVFDGLVDELKKWRWIPDLRIAMRYHDHPLYIEALVQSIRKEWEKNGKPAKLLFSFHGIPKRYFDNGDPYFCFCQKTARLTVEKLGLSKDEYIVSFQSLFGKEEWLRPYTLDTVQELGRAKLKRLDVVCPAFFADCLETLEEIDVLNREEFHKAGGGEFRYIPALNANPEAIKFLAALVTEQCSDWKTSYAPPLRIAR